MRISTSKLLHTTRAQSVEDTGEEVHNVDESKGSLAHYVPKESVALCAKQLNECMNMMFSSIRSTALHIETIDFDV
mgnify:CR=1 FL=1